jgi:hypothetical protein
MICNVLGLGDTVKAFRPDGNLTIGCNDIFRYHSVDILIVVSSLPYNRGIFVQNAKPKMLLSHMPRWSNHPAYEKIPDMHPWRTDRKNEIGKYIYRSSSTPFIAATWAFMMGFTQIVLWGVDFTDHPIIKDQTLEQEKLHFVQLQEHLREKGASMYLGSRGSVLPFDLWR